MVSGLDPTLVSSGIFRYQLLFNELVEPVQIDVRQDRGCYAPNGAPLRVAL
jgi:hypothetical protein